VPDAHDFDHFAQLIEAIDDSIRPKDDLKARPLLSHLKARPRLRLRYGLRRGFSDRDILERPDQFRDAAPNGQFGPLVR
jgi:hypothetical protein